jgi:hypothetical protein
VGCVELTGEVGDVLVLVLVLSVFVFVEVLGNEEVLEVVELVGGGGGVGAELEDTELVLDVVMDELEAGELDVGVEEEEGDADDIEEGSKEELSIEELMAVN